jgi:two-component system, cell cycle sensor histidine kinase and response regulator CckA
VARLQFLVTDVILRRRHQGLPVLYISGYTHDAFEDGTVGASSHFLPKPFTPSELLASVRETLDLPQGS